MSLGSDFNLFGVDPAIFARGVGVLARLPENSSDNVFFLVLSLFYSFTESVQWLFRRNYDIQRFQRGANIFQGCPSFSRGGGGVQTLIYIEAHITFDFQGGICTPYFPLDRCMRIFARKRKEQFSKLRQSRFCTFL